MAVLHACFVIKGGSWPNVDQRNASLVVLDASQQLRGSSHVNSVRKDTSPVMCLPSCARRVPLGHMQTQRERLSVLHVWQGGSLLAQGQRNVILVGQDGIRLMVRQNARNVPLVPFQPSPTLLLAIFVLMAVGSSSWGAHLVTIVQSDFRLLEAVGRLQIARNALQATAMHCQDRRACNVKQALSLTKLALHSVSFVQSGGSRITLVQQCAKIVQKERSLSR
mmetsp:Transcript_103079/g.160766  ORF Transcript_103079/g.160766 Transcript_103079/m.160766 type:complete len:222 (+) Transcript_103079:153-818(+)